MRSEWLGLNLSQRETAKQSGSAFPDYGDATYRRHAYDARGELVSAWAYLGSTVTATTSPLPGRKDDYAYDSIGNRKWANRSGNAGLKESFFGDTAGTAEGANALNQCLSKENDTLPVQGTVDAAGTAVVAGVTAPVAASRQGRYWAAELEVANGSGPWSDVAAVYTAKVGGGTGGADLIGSLSRPGLLGAKVQSFTYDNDGNLTGDGIWNYSWDAENRLIRMETTAAAISAGIANRVLEFRYDSMHRRVQKRVLQGATSAEISSRRYLYDGWNLLAEFTAPGGNSCGSVVRSYTWGLDLAGSLAATGGVGALLQIRDEAMDLTLLAAYDGNGNVAALVDHASGAIQAAYEYDPFGQLLRAEGNYARHNPYRFSTRFHDVDVARQRGDGPTGRLARRASRAGARMGSETRQTGLAYYGRRFYSPALGRFISRDPIEESGGLNLYGFVGNDPANAVDRLGLDVFVAWGWGYWDWLGGGVDDLYGPRGFSWGLVAMEDFGPLAVAPRFPDRIAGTGLPAGPLPRQPYSRIALNRTKSPTDISVASRLFNDAPNNADNIWRAATKAAGGGARDYVVGMGRGIGAVFEAPGVLLGNVIYNGDELLAAVVSLPEALQDPLVQLQILESIDRGLTTSEGLGEVAGGLVGGAGLGKGIQTASKLSSEAVAAMRVLQVAKNATNPMREVLARARPVGDRLEAILDDGTKVIIRREVGPKAHPLPGHPKPVGHWNIEIHRPIPGRPGRFEQANNVHIILDSAGNPTGVIYTP